MIFAIYLLIGCISSFLSGLLGIGGGLIIVPALSFVFTKFHIIAPQQLMHIVVATSLASAIVNLMFSVKTYHQHGSVRWSILLEMLPGIILGALVLAPSIMFIIKGEYLKVMFGIFCLVMAIQMLVGQKYLVHSQENLPNKIGMFFIGLTISSISTLLGITGGVLTRQNIELLSC